MTQIKLENLEVTEMTFEASFARLEEILGRLNGGNVSLDESLKLYEEANQLITVCDKRLNEAERKIEVLVKNRQGELTIGNHERPVTQDYTPVSS